MPFEKNQPPTGSISIEMRNTSGVFIAGTPAVTVSKDGGAYAAYAGGLSPIPGTTGQWEYTPAVSETNAGKFKVMAVLSGAVDVTREVLPESSYTAARAGYLDTLNGIVAAVWGYAARTLTAAADTSGVTTLLARLTAGRASNLDNLDAAVSSRSTFAGGAVASVTAPVTVGTNNDKDGYGLTSAYDRAKTAARPSEVAPTIAFNPTINPTAVTIADPFTPATKAEILTAIGSPQQAGQAVTLPDPAPEGYGGSASGGLNAEQAKQLSDTAAKVALIGATQVVVASPVLSDGTVFLTAGFDYLAVDGIAPSWRRGSWPDLTGAVVTLELDDADELPGVVVGSGDAQSVSVDFPADALPNGSASLPYRLIAVFTDGRRVLLAKSTVEVSEE